MPLKTEVNIVVQTECIPLSYNHLCTPNSVKNIRLHVSWTNYSAIAGCNVGCHLLDDFPHVRICAANNVELVPCLQNLNSFDLAYTKVCPNFVTSYLGVCCNRIGYNSKVLPDCLTNIHRIPVRTCRFHDNCSVNMMSIVVVHKQDKDRCICI